MRVLVSLRTLVVLTLLYVGCPVQAQPTLQLAIASGMSKIRPTEPLPADAHRGGSVELTAARGECEAAQVVVTAASGPEQGVRASADALRSSEGKTLRPVLYREAFLDLRQPSDIEGAAGLWPDPLIPAVDEIVHEPRNAFPVDVPEGRHQPIYVEVCVPRDATPGAYSGGVVITAEGRPPARVPVRVTVQSVTIPATSSLPITFGLSEKSVQLGHYGERRDDGLSLLKRYAWDALRHRISLYAMSMRPPRVSGSGNSLHVDFRSWDAEIGPYLDGLVGLDGAQFSTIDLRTPRGLAGADLTAYYRQVVAHFQQRGWLDRLFAYVMDEPKPEQYPELIRRLDAFAAVPQIRRLVTVPLDSALLGKVDIWTPNLNCMDFKLRPDEFCHHWASRQSYDARLAHGEQLWWYQSCSSHGCGEPRPGTQPNRYFAGWPSYMIDIDGAAARIMGWLAFSRHIGGELYFDTVFAYNRFAADNEPRQDPWDNLRAFGGNGDGTLFYPGRPDRIGGKTDIPIESLRLKQIRDGLEDYELLHLLASKGPDGARRAQAIADRMTPRLYQYERSPAAFETAREEIFKALASP